jgi:hypothetical protein
MFNPYALYEAKYLEGFKTKGVKAFVKQTYDRGRNLLEQNPGPAFLLTHYNEIKMAINHMDAISNDPERRLFMFDNFSDLLELQRIGRPGAEELVYMSLKTPGAEQKAKKILDKKLRAYISFKLNWLVPASETVQFSLEFIFGEIYAVLRHGHHSHKVKMEEIETTKGYVL